LIARKVPRRVRRTRCREEIVGFSRKLRNSPIAAISRFGCGSCALFPSFLFQDVRIVWIFRSVARISSRDYVVSLLERFNEGPVDTFHGDIESSKSSLQSFISVSWTHQRDHGRQDWKIFFAEISRKGRRTFLGSRLL